MYIVIQTVAYWLSDRFCNSTQICLWPASMPCKVFTVIALCVSITACGGGSDPAPSNPDESTPGELQNDENPDEGVIGELAPFAGPNEPLPDELAELDQVSLRIQPENRCVEVGQSLSLSVTRADGDSSSTPFSNTTAFVQFTQSLGDSLRLISRGDESADFELVQEDIVALTSEIDNGSVTAYLAGFASGTASSAILRKPVVGGCLYAFRIPGYCATGFAKRGAFSFSRDGISMSAEGCELQNPDNLPVIELGN